MKKTVIRIVLALCALLAAAACQKEGWPEGADLTSLRIALSPDPGVIPADGIADFETVVIVARGPETSVPWNVSVDFTPDWLTLEKVSVTGQFIGTWEGDDRETVQDGIKLNVQANTGAKRTAVIRFTVSDGSSITYTLTQAKGKQE